MEGPIIMLRRLASTAVYFVSVCLLIHTTAVSASVITLCDYSSNPDAPPSAVDDMVVMPPAGMTIPVLQNDVVAYGRMLSIKSITGAQHAAAGSPRIDGAGIYYQPVLAANGTVQADTFTYTIQDDSGSGMTSTATVHVSAAGGAIVIPTCTSGECTFETRPSKPDPVQSFYWTWGDGQQGFNVQDPYHQYTATSNYPVTVKLTYYSGEVEVGTCTAAVFLSATPIWPVTVNSLTVGIRPNTNSFNTFPGGPNAWDIYVYWGAGWQDTIYYTPTAITCGTGQCTPTSNTFNRGGSYKVALVMDHRGTPLPADPSHPEINPNHREFDQWVTLQDNPPIPKFNANIKQRTVYFDGGTSTDEMKPDATVDPFLPPSPAYMPHPYVWDLGDGGSWTDLAQTFAGPAVFSHTYTNLGTYNVSLKLTDYGGNTATTTVPVTIVNTPPLAKLEYDCNGIQCQFRSDSVDDGRVVSQLWDLGDNTTATTEVVTRNYASAGCYAVGLTVTDDNSAPGSTKQTISIGSVPLAAAPGVVTDAHSRGYVSNYQHFASTGDLDGVAEPGESVVVEPLFTTRPTTVPWYVASSISGGPSPASSVSDLAVKFVNDSGAAYDLTTGTGNCLPLNGCHVLDVGRTTLPRNGRHIDISWKEPTPAGGTLPVLVHVGDSFTDVPRSVWYYGYVESIFHAGYTSGCGNGAYCPATILSRDQLAVWLILATSPPGFVLPACVPPGPFNDVPCGSFAADYIAEMKKRAYTAGTGGGNYSPRAPVTRYDMAVFLLRGLSGGAYLPPHCTRTDYADVPCLDTPSSGGAQAADWIGEAQRRGITFGCATPGNYCPSDSIDRAQSAAFFVRAFKNGVDKRQCPPGTPIYQSTAKEDEQK